MNYQPFCLPSSFVPASETVLVRWHYSWYNIMAYAIDTVTQCSGDFSMT